MKGLFIPEITAEMFRNGCLESIEALMAEGEIYDIDYPLEQQPSEDCISRDAVIQIIENKLNPCTDMFKCLEMSEVKEDVEHLPSVTPQSLKQIKWERDTAINQLKELGYGFGERIEKCEDCISREDVLKTVNSLTEICDRDIVEKITTLNNIDWIKMKINEIPSVTPQQTRWIPIKTRPMTEEEKEEIGHEYAFMYDCPLPDDGQDVLVTDCYGNVEVDTLCRDHEGFYFETNCDDGEVIAWMPLLEPYKAESEVKADE